jgi:hypothetical protein
VLDQVLPKLPGRTDDADPHATLPSWILRWPPQPNEARRAAFETTRGYRISWPRRAAIPDDRRESVQAPVLATASRRGCRISPPRRAASETPAQMKRSNGFWEGAETNQSPGNRLRVDAADLCDSLRHEQEPRRTPRAVSPRTTGRTPPAARARPPGSRGSGSDRCAFQSHGCHGHEAPLDQVLWSGSAHRPVASRRTHGSRSRRRTAIRP